MEKISEYKNHTSIEDIRKQIDIIDKEIINLFAKRNEQVKEIVQFKNNEIEVIAQSRKDSVIKQRGIWAKESGLNAKLFEKLYTILIDHNIETELDILKLKQSK